MKTTILCTSLAAGLALISPLSAQRTQEPAPGPGPGTTWSLAAVGDAIITRRVALYDNPADPARRTR